MCDGSDKSMSELNYKFLIFKKIQFKTCTETNNSFQVKITSSTPKL